jgi:GTP:adenosylcobinamide-phosphate guanylyltransferase
MPENMKDYAGKTISPTMEAFADFLIAEVYGGELPEGMDEATFRRAVMLGGSTRGYFQKSEAWKADSRNYLANVEANREAKAAEKAARAKEQAAKAVAKAKELEAKLAEATKAAKAKAAKLAAEAKAEAKAEAAA